jgi:diguanylate cyclase (GGDEF)-like protein
MVAALWAGVWLQIRSDFHEQLTVIEEEMSSQTMVMEAHVVRTVKDLDRAMLIIRDYIEIERLRNGGAIPWEALRLPEPEILGDAAFQISIVDENGFIQGSNIPLRQIVVRNISDRQHFRTHEQIRADSLFISPPILRISSGRWSIQLTRPLVAPSKGFRGIINGAIDPGQLFAIHPPIQTGGAGSLSVLGLDGIVRASTGAEPLEIGARRSDLAIFERMYRRSWSTFEGELTVDSGAKFISYRKVDGYPLVLVIAKSRKDALATYHRRRADCLLFGGIVTLIIVFGSANGWRYQRKLRQAVTTAELSEEAARSKSRELAHLAQHDVLTELANRALFQERLESAVEGLAKGHTFALLLVDVDDFKTINDTLGHAVGDALLKEIAERLRRCARDTDVVARLGGDEFAIVQHGAHLPTNADDLAQRLLDLAREPLYAEGNEIIISMSIGIALAPEHGTTASELLKAADLALYRAKSLGRNAACIFEVRLTEELQRRRSLELELHSALAQQQFQLWYQPIFSLQSGAICGFEALLRWQHPVRGLVSPADFIPIAEETGIIHEIGRWVLNEAAEQALSWPGHLSVAVNLSPCQFKERNIADLVAHTLDSTGLEGSRLELEITETALLQNSADVAAQFARLKRLGIRLAMDDFGTGYSSLSYLRRFPFDKIKIDRSFVAEIAQDEGCAAIVHAIIELAGRLGMVTTAEGIETTDQLEWLCGLGCTEAQGFVFSPPLRPDDASHLAGRVSEERQRVA